MGDKIPGMEDGSADVGERRTTIGDRSPNIGDCSPRMGDDVPKIVDSSPERVDKISKMGDASPRMGEKIKAAIRVPPIVDKFPIAGRSDSRDGRQNPEKNAPEPFQR